MKQNHAPRRLISTATQSLQTSREALKQATTKIERDRLEILAFIKKQKNRGFTSNEIEAALIMRRASSRINELYHQGRLIQSTQKKRNDGRNGPGSGGTAQLLFLPKKGAPIVPIPYEKTKTRVLREMLEKIVSIVASGPRADLLVACKEANQYLATLPKLPKWKAIR